MLSTSKEYLRVKITDADGEDLDQTVSIGIRAEGATEITWHTAEWISDVGPSRIAGLMIGPAHVQLTAGTYTAYGSVVDNPEEPQLPAFTFTVRDY